jgi:hypothetical protein
MRFDDESASETILKRFMPILSVIAVISILYTSITELIIVIIST